MKVKDAIIQLNKQGLTNEYNPTNRELLLELFITEFTNRQHLRFGQRDVSYVAFDSLLTEMIEWVKKIMLVFGFSQTDSNEFSQLLLTTTKDIANKYTKVG
jgi:hypothetical protein